MILPGEYDLTAEWIAGDYPHRCTISRRTEIGQTPLDEPIWGEWHPFGEDIPCFYYWRSGGERNESGRRYIEYEHRLLIPRWIGVEETDKIAEVRDHNDQPFMSPDAENPLSPMGIRSIGIRSTNKVLILREVR